MGDSPTQASSALLAAFALTAGLITTAATSAARLRRPFARRRAATSATPPLFGGATTLFRRATATAFAGAANEVGRCALLTRFDHALACESFGERPRKLLRFDAEGVKMSWGVLFRREINLTYARIQDIHLTSNILERWLGLARIQIQTASGSSGAEMTIEGVREFERLRDFLYSKMRGTKTATAGSASTTPLALGAQTAELTATLREVAAELRALRLAHEGARAEERDG